LENSSYSVNADIGCYSLGASLGVPESIVCMGASVGMARGAAEAGIKHPIAIIGDSTFLHSGITSLIDAAVYNSPITVVILDNSTIAMTGCQDTILRPGSLKPLLEGLGIAKEHLLFLPATGQKHEENLHLFKAEMEHRGLSVVVFQRECIEAARKRLKRQKREKS
jgi:indolepyruvate ferredoxin oxidoreductase alpha subunit